MPRKRGLPSKGELVIVKISKINPNSVFATLSEYPGLEGMVHISEIATGWVRDIRQHVKQDQETVAIILTSQPLSLSFKRVNPKQKASKLREWDAERRAEKMLEMTSRQLGKTLDQAYEEVGFILQERFGTIFEAFKLSLIKPEKLTKIVSQEWIDVMCEVAEKTIMQKEFTFSAKLDVRSYVPHGIECIRNVLRKAEKSGLKVHYVAAPSYLVRYSTKDPKKGLKEMNEKLDKLVGENDVEVKYIVEE
jgi:translation initiation factor 2 subunit 1